MPPRTNANADRIYAQSQSSLVSQPTRQYGM